MEEQKNLNNSPVSQLSATVAPKNIPTTAGVLIVLIVVVIIGAGITNSAVNLCSGTINGYNDWFLPAKEQLNCLYSFLTF